MKKIYTLFFLTLWSLVSMGQTVTLTFTGLDIANRPIAMDSVSVVNLTRGWQEKLYYPDTILIMTNHVGVDSYTNTSFRLLQSGPNPFNGNTEVLLQTSENESVCLEVFDLNGKLVTSMKQKVDAGIHSFKIGLAVPQTYLLNVKSSKHVVAPMKLVNMSSNGQNTIEYVGGKAMQGSDVKGQTDNTFVFGDMMEYIGYVTVDGEVYESNRITQAQGTNQTFVLSFPVSGTVPSGAGLIFWAPLTSNTVDVVSGDTGTIHGNPGAYTAEGLDFNRAYVSFTSGCWQNFNYSTPFTVICDYKRTGEDVGAHMHIVTNNTSSYDRGFLIYCQARYCNNMRVGLVHTYGSASATNQETLGGIDNTAILDSMYVNSGFIYDGNGTITRIQNGVITNVTKTYSQADFPNFTNVPLGIGGALGTNLNHWIGYIRNVRIYDHALTSKELEALGQQ